MTDSARPREVQRERSVIAEAVECAAARPRADQDAILALVEERAGLLPAPRRREKPDSVFVDLDLVRHVVRAAARHRRQTFLRAQRRHRCERECRRSARRRRARRRSRRGTPRVPRSSVARRASDRSDRRPVTGSRRLRRGPVGTRSRGRERRGAARSRRRCAVCHHAASSVCAGIAVDHSQRDLRRGAPERDTDRLAAMIVDTARRPPADRTLRHVAAIDPGMAAVANVVRLWRTRPRDRT